MSNHSGSYMLNDVLNTLQRYSVFDALGKEKTQAMVIEIIKMSQQYDYNPGEILENMDERLGICHFCLSPADEFHDGICKKCHERLVAKHGYLEK
ncbi:hypothetical protein [Candidatus Thiosymbion oneisti]|uniref:hypothetical protein n=1 Tax=Candidatus Thiosymbion oneisti TaxID=589554 RepID=UPI000AEC6761|nr:hypothetical protein [Candidatus Thiosymbion oneisti]